MRAGRGFSDPSAGRHDRACQPLVALSKLKETGLANVPDSLYRDHRVLKVLQESGDKLDVDDLKRAFFDDFGAPFCVCRAPLAKEGGNLSATVAMILCEPVKGVMEIAPLPAINRNFTRYELAMDDDAFARAAGAPDETLGRGERWSASS
jgi:isopenicillin-N N-acyltransferase-like protein